MWTPAAAATVATAATAVVLVARLRLLPPPFSLPG